MGLIVEVGTREVAPSVFKGYLKVLDGEKNMHDALTNNAGLGATVYAFHDKGAYGSATQHTFGEWSHSPSNSGGATGTTTFQDTAGDIKTFMKGWLLVPAVQELGYLEITDVDTSLDKVVVKGDADSLSGIGQRYWLVAPAGVDPATGALETDPCKMGSLWLWAGYHYRAPIVGFHTTPPSQSAGTYGAQTGNNKLGNYYCWNRIYEPSTGRWTTPDPVDSPAGNLFDTDEKPKKKCCCAKELSVYPADAKTNPELEGKQEIGAHGWSKMLEDTIEASKKAGEPFTEKQIEAVKKLIYGSDGKKLGREDVKTEAGEYVLFKFQSVGEVEWIEWDGNTEPDCTFDQQVTRTNTDGTVVAKKSDFAAANQDPNTDAGGKNALGKYGARVKLSDSKYSWVDPVITDFATVGTTKRAFEMTLTSAAACPCKKASVTKRADLEVDTTQKPPTVKWSVK